MSENTFHFSLVSPERVLLSEQVQSVTVPGADGEFGVLKNHAPILSSLQDGVATIVLEDGTEEQIFVAGGFADVNDNICTILAEDAEKVSDLDRDTLTQDREVLEHKLSLLDGEEDAALKIEPLKQQITRIDMKLSLAA